jgi:hypothetical protein
MFRLDKTAFKVQTFKEADNDRAYWLSKTPAERLQAAWYLTCAAYGLDPNKKHRMDKTVYSVKKHSL